MRYLKVVLSSLALFMLYMWIAIMFNACGGNKTDEFTTDDSEYVEDGEFESGEDDEFAEEEYEINEDADDEEMMEDEELDDKVADDVDPGDYTSPPVRTPTTPKVNSGNTNGKYMVIAGSYLIQENADKMVKKLQNEGFEAEIVHFNHSQYHSVCAGRYSNNSTANQSAKTLKNMGIDAYVHTRQD